MPDPTPQVVELSNRFRAQLLARERRAASAMVRYYGAGWASLQDNISTLQAEYDRRVAAGEELTPGQIWRLERMQAIQAQVEAELSKFAPFAADTVAAGQRESIAAGERNTYELVQGSFLPEMGVNVNFATMPRAAVEQMVGFLADGSPLNKVIEGYVGDAKDRFGETLVTGLVSGWNPRKLARELRGSYGMGLTNALRLARTEQLRAYRTAAINTYRANSHVVEGWERHAALDNRTCLACLVLDGKRYGLDEEMDDHVQGRCLTPGQTIATSDGPQLIEDIEIGDKVLTHKGRYRRVTAISARAHVGKVLIIEQGNCRLTVTPEHSLLTQRGWVEAKDLMASDTLPKLYGMLVRVSKRSTTQPLRRNRRSFRRSMGRFFAESCQRLSYSMASLISGNAKSMLYLSKAYSGMGLRPSARNAERNAFSPSFITSWARRWRDFALFLRARGLPAALCIGLRKSGLRRICRRTACRGDIGSMSHLRIRRIMVRMLRPISALSSRYVAFSSTYRRCNQSQIGSPSRSASSCSKARRSTRPRSLGVFLSPSFLARWWTAFVVRPGKRAAMPAARFVQKLSRMIVSSASVHLLPTIQHLLDHVGIDNSIHQSKIVVNCSPYAGLVYNLQVTEDESYIANGIIVHNCAMLPITKSYAELGIDAPEPDFTREKGADWFRRQDEATQRRMMGPGKYNAWKDGLFALEDIPKVIKSDVWGNSWVPKSLGELTKKVGQPNVMTEAQGRYRADLVERKVQRLLSHQDVNSVLRAFLAVNLPEPTDKRDVSAQIDALKSDIRKYKAEYAQRLLNRLGNEGARALVEDVKQATSLDRQLDLARQQGTSRLADIAPQVISRLMQILRAR